MNEDIKNKIETIINSAPIVLFMKGDKYMPMCGFSANTVEILTKLDLEYTTFDILEDEEVRQGIKEYSEWPTFPQLYIKGELIGGNDIVQEMYDSGELVEVINKKK